MKGFQLTPGNSNGRPSYSFTRAVLLYLLLGLFANLGLFSPVVPLAQAAGVVNPCTETALVAALAGGGTVTFGCSGTITLTTTPTTGILIAANTVIDGSGQNVTISGGNTRRMFNLQGGVTLDIRNLTFTNGTDLGTDGGVINTNPGSILLVSKSTFSNNRSIHYGSTIENRGTTTITDTTFSNNNSQSDTGVIENDGTLFVRNSTFSGNTATGVGATIYNDVNGNATISNSTFFGNTANLGGGALFNGFNDTMTIINSTLAGNRGAGTGDFVYNVGGTVTLRNTIVTNSTPGQLCNGPIVNGGNNLQFGDNTSTCGAGIPVANPLLGPLANNGGPTQTMALGAGSPAIDQGNNAVCAAAPVNNLDQRGVTRPLGSACDIGAYEQVATTLNLTLSFNPAVIEPNNNSVLSFVLNNPTGSALTNVSFNSTLPSQLTIVGTATNACGSGTVTATPGTGSVSASGVALANNQTCAITVTVTSKVVGKWTVTVNSLSSSQTGAFAINASATLTVQLPQAGLPADLILQLRITPDRYASTDPANMISYSFKVKNVGPGKAVRVALRLPIDPNLTVGYASFSDSRMWVSAIVRDVDQPYLQIGMPDLDPNSQEFSGTLVFRPASTAKAGAVIFSRLFGAWDDDNGTGKKVYSNGVRFNLSSDNTNRDETGGAVQLFSPATTSVSNFSTLTITGDFYAPNESINLWITDKNGVSTGLGTSQADANGNFKFDLTVLNLAVGDSYSVVGFGSRSEVSGSTIITVVAPPSPQTLETIDIKKCF
jgi:hypothetical protein